MEKKIKLPIKDQSKIRSRYFGFCEANRKLILIERQFKTCVGFSFVMFAIFSFGMMQPIVLRDLVGEAVVKSVQISLLLGVGLAIFLLEKKTKVTHDRFNLSNELQQTWGLMVDYVSKNNYRVTMATGENNGLWIITDIDLYSDSFYDDISAEEWTVIRDGLP